MENKKKLKKICFFGSNILLVANYNVIITSANSGLVLKY